jgi:hypothetical protein
MNARTSGRPQLEREADREGVAIKRLIAEQREPGRTTPYPLEVRERLLAHAMRFRAGGLSWKRIGASVGVSGWVLERWSQGAQQGPTSPNPAVSMVPVRVALEESVPGEGTRAQERVLWSPGGYRVEGLSLSDLTDLLRALP